MANTSGKTGFVDVRINEALTASRVIDLDLVFTFRPASDLATRFR